MTLTPRSQEQLADALAEANDARHARAIIKQQVRAGKLTIGEVLDLGHRAGGDWIAQRIEVGQLLRAVKGVGPKKAIKHLAAAGITDSHKHLAQLSAQHVEALKAALDG